MSEYIISQNSNDVCYAYSRGRFWRWDESAHVWKESHLLAQKFDKARAAEKHLTPETFLTSDEFIPMDDYELPGRMIAALRDAKPCKAAPVDPVEEESSSDVAAQCGNIPADSSFDFSALGDLSEQAVAADQQFDLHYGAAQDEYLISCIYLARIHILTAKAGRYGGGTWTKWYESKGLSEGSARTMVKNGDAFNSATVAELKQLPELTRKDLNLIVRSGCAEQVVAAGGDSQRVQALLAQIKAEKKRADAAETREEEARKAAHEYHKKYEEAAAMRATLLDQQGAYIADIDGLTKQNAKLQQSYHDADEGRIAARLQCQKAEGERDRAEERAKDAENQLAGSRQVAEAAKLRGDKLKAENDALKKQPITAVVDKEEVERQAREMAAEMTADLRAQLEQAASGSEQDTHSSYDNVLLADRSFQNIGKMVVPSLRRLPPEQREQLTNMLVHTLGQIQGEVSRCL